MAALRTLTEILAAAAVPDVPGLLRRGLLAAAVLGATALGTLPAGAGEMGHASATQGEMHGAPADTPERWSVLDGKVFKGEFGALGEHEAMGTDAWIFEEGMFASENCIECGFPESPYWVAFGEDKTTFRASTQCPVSDAIITWRGTIKDGRIEGVYTWTKERWYWTVEREYWFSGTLKNPASDKTVSIE